MKDKLIEFYMDYANNYLTVTKMAEDYGLSLQECKSLIEIGRKYYFDKWETTANRKATIKSH